jgi:L-amino acid N-acyltransferase YncA
LFGFVSQTEPVGYVHVMAVRGFARRRHFGQKLFSHFIQFAQRQGCRHIKAITTPTNLGSIAFHKSLGMQLLGMPNVQGIPIVRDYSGHGEARVVFWKAI